MLWYARDEGNVGYYVFSTRKLIKKENKMRHNHCFFDDGGREIRMCAEIVERAFASKDMQLEPGEGPFKLEPLRRAK